MHAWKRRMSPSLFDLKDEIYLITEAVPDYVNSNKLPERQLAMQQVSLKGYSIMLHKRKDQSDGMNHLWKGCVIRKSEYFIVECTTSFTWNHVQKFC